jgi:hypothetical protein
MVEPVTISVFKVYIYGKKFKRRVVKVSLTGERKQFTRAVTSIFYEALQPLKEETIKRDNGIK